MAVKSRVAALTGAAGVALFALSGTAFAEDKLEWSASLTGTSDYVFRGISQTNNDPTVQGSLGLTYGMFYVGVWGSGLDWAADPTADLEVDYYGGITPTWGQFNFDFGLIYYTYPGSFDKGAPENDYLEWKAGVNTEIYKGLSGGFTFFYSDDVLDEREYVYEGTLSYELPKVWVLTPTVSGLVGYTDWETTADYTYWNAGLALAVDNLTFDFRYWDSDISATSCGQGTKMCDERFVFSATVSMP